MKTNTLNGASLRSAAIAEAKRSGYATVILVRGTSAATDMARRFEPDGSYSEGKVGSYRYCPNFNGSELHS